MTIGASALQWLPPATYGRSYGVANGLNQLPSEAANAIAWETLNGQNTGNMASASLDGSATITSFAHDGMNRMVTASRAGMAAAYSYDIDDRRIGKTVTQTSTISTRTLWSGTDELAEYDGAGALLRRVIPGPAIDDKVAVVEASGAVSYFHTDRLGSVVAVSNGAGAASETYAYSPYGESANPVTGNPWRYTGRYLDTETGLYYYRARYYAPRLGQFLQTDPIGSKDDPNLYMYVGLDPGNKTDPSGKQSFSINRMREIFTPSAERADQKDSKADPRAPLPDPVGLELPKVDVNLPISVGLEVSGTASGVLATTSGGRGVVATTDGSVVVAKRESTGGSTDPTLDQSAGFSVSAGNLRNAGDVAGMTTTATATLTVGGVSASASYSTGTASDGYRTHVVSLNASTSTPDVELSGSVTRDNTTVEGVVGGEKPK